MLYCIIAILVVLFGLLVLLRRFPGYVIYITILLIQSYAIHVTGIKWIAVGVVFTVLGLLRDEEENK